MVLSGKALIIHTYLKVNNQTKQGFKGLAENLIEITRGEMGCLFYGFSYAENEACCREGYKDAESFVAHLDNIEDLLHRLNSLTECLRLEIHGPLEEIAKLRGWPSLNQLNPTYYVFDAGFSN